MDSENLYMDWINDGIYLKENIKKLKQNNEFLLRKVIALQEIMKLLNREKKEKGENNDTNTKK